MKSCVCAVFAKPPRPGSSKTRLAASIGPEAAAALAEAFLKDTADALTSLDLFDVVLSTPEPDADHGVSLPRWDQGGGDLGLRLMRTFARARERWPAAIAVGADSPGIPPDRLRAIVALLETHAAVLGPTDDGGFFALGISLSRDLPLDLLAGIPWSSAQTAGATRDRLTASGLTVAETEPWWDIDTGADLERFRREIPRGRAPQTWRVLDTLSGREVP